MKKVIFITSLISGLIGCASVSQTYVPDGRIGYAVNCRGDLRNWSMCLSEAGKICGANGYDVLNSGNRSMLIACKK